MKFSRLSTDLEAIWFGLGHDKTANLEDRATYAVWYVSGPGRRQYLALTKNRRDATEVMALFDAIEEASPADARAIEGEINRIALVHVEIKPGWPPVRGGKVYEVPGNFVVRVINKTPYHT